jgi:hypothetical protein
MIMIKKHQRWVALLVIFTFLWLLQLSSMPLSASGTSEQVNSASPEQGPDYYEAVSHKAAPAKKKSILPFILIGVGVITITAVVVILLVLKSYDITGNWQSNWHYNELGWDYDIDFTFTGNKKTGTVIEGYWGGTGTYTVDGKNVTFSIIWNNGNTAHFTGTFTDKDAMSGTFYETLWANTGTWTAIRGGSGAGIPKVNARGPKRGGEK